MANFLKDNADLLFYLDKGIDWGPLVTLVERADLGSKDGFETVDEAVGFYKEVLDLVGRFVADEVAPHTEEIDRGGVIFEDGEVRFPERLESIFEQLNELGLHSLCVPRELDGMNCPLLVYMIVTEVFSRADVSAMAHFSFHGGIAMALLLYSVFEGSTEFDPESWHITSTRFEKEIREIATGQAWGSMDITEPDAGSDMAAIRAVAEQDKDGGWVLTGQKIFITSGHGKYHVVIARTEKAADTDDPFAGLGGLSLFMVPAWTEDADGNRVRLATLDRIEEKMGHHGSATCSLTFDRTPAHLLGERGEGFKQMLLLMNNARVGVSFESLGLCEAAYRLASEYAAERKSMGKTIDRHEMIADYLDEMRTDIQGIRALIMDAAYHEEMSRRMDMVLRANEQAGNPVDADLVRRQRRHGRRSRRFTPLIKYIASEKAVEMSRRSVQILGGVGYMREYGAEKLLRDAMVFPIYEGTSQIQALMAMKDKLTRVIRKPADLVSRRAQARWRCLSARDPLERGVARIQSVSLAAQQKLLMRTAVRKLKGVTQKPLTQWREAAAEGWDPKRDFAHAMLHAERLTRILIDEAICEVLWQQAQAHPERREVLERYLERAEPRCRFLFDEISTTGNRLIESLRDEAAEADQEVA